MPERVLIVLFLAAAASNFFAQIGIGHDDERLTLGEARARRALSEPHQFVDYLGVDRVWPEVPDHPPLPDDIGKFHRCHIQSWRSGAVARRARRYSLTAGEARQAQHCMLTIDHYTGGTKEMTVTNIETARERLFAEIDRREGELIELIQQLVRCKSTLGNEAEPQQIIADYIRESGVEPDVWDLNDAVLALPGAGNSGVPFAGRPNVAAVYPGVGNGRSLILNGHIDVVSSEPDTNWTRDPWAASIEGRRMYGRGAYDMKCGTALNVFLARLIRDIDIQLGGDLIVESIIEEECTGNGALAACFRDGADSTRYRADEAIISEPTDGRYIAAHVGVIWFRVNVLGESAHAAVAWKGVNAIYRMMPIIEELRALDAEMNTESHPDYAGIEHPINLNVGVIRGGDWPSSVAGECAIECRLSMFPGVTVEETRSRVVAAIDRAIERDGWLSQHPPTIEWYGFQSPGSIIAPEEEIVQTLARHHLALRGDALLPINMTGTTDMRNFNVYSGIPAFCYGPSGFGAHAADEWLDLDSLIPTARVIGATILDWCGVTRA